MKPHRPLAAILSLFLIVGHLSAADPVNLLAEATWQYSTDDGATYSADPVVIAPETNVNVTARTQFRADPAGLAALELHGRPPGRTTVNFTLNDQKLTGPMPEMVYKTMPAIDPALLKAGENTLLIQYAINNTSAGRFEAKETTLTADARLFALAPEHLVIQSGPIMGMSDDDTFTFTLRTNIPAKVTVTADSGNHAPIYSSGTLFHRLAIPRDLAPVTLTAAVPGHSIRQRIDAPAWDTESLQFIILGDSRTNPEDWRKVAAAANARDPQFLVVSGDMIAAGKDDASWDREFFGPGRDLLARTPTYVVIGNHEQNAPLYDEMFITPGEGGKNRNWSQRIGGTLLIGIDGAQDWTADSDNARWLEQLLADSDDVPFIFLACHYPAWSSSSHGKVDENDLPVERPMRQMRQTVSPLLSKYKVTAMFAGHDHTYERSEVDGVTHITSGGAGAPRYPQAKAAEKQNPHSLVYSAVLHFCELIVSDDTCTMTAYTPEGEVLDTRAWPARQVAPVLQEAAR